MNEEKVIDILLKNEIRMIASLPCDKNRGFTSAIHERFDVADLTREEDGVGICAGAYLAGVRSAISIQSSGLGNMMNALMSLTATYGMPLPILASWRGVENEVIEAQVPFNSKIPEMLNAFDIPYYVVNTPDDIDVIDIAVKRAYSENKIVVVLIKPSIWGKPPATVEMFPRRTINVNVTHKRLVSDPQMKRLDSISVVMNNIDDDAVIVSNIGVPSKEVFACKDRTLNFYMLGSYTQASAIGLGTSMYTKRKVFVIDGDGSILGSSVLPVVASVSPDNLTIFCMDNGTFGSTGNQIDQAYSITDLELVARGCGVANTSTVSNEKEIVTAISDGVGPRFVRAIIKPGNSDSPNITMTASDIKKRFMKNMPIVR